MSPGILRAMVARMSGGADSPRLAKSGLQTVVVSAIRILVGFGVSIVLARSLKPSGLGVYSIALSIVTLLSVGTKLGLPFPLVREIAALKAKDDNGTIRRLLQRANTRVAITSLLGIVATGGAILTLAGNAAWTTPAVAALGLLPFLALESIQAAGLRGLGFVPLSHASAPLLREAMFLLMLLAAAVLGFPQGTPINAMFLHAVAGAAAVVIGASWLLRRSPQSRPHGSSGGRLAGAGTFLSLEALQTLGGHLDVLLLAWLLGPADVGLYKVALAVGGMTLFFGSAAGLVVQPEFARAHRDGNFNVLQRLATAHVRTTSVATAPLFIAFLALGPFLLEAVYGVEYRPAFAPLAIIAAGQFFNVLTGPVGTLLNMTGHERETIRGYGISTSAAIVTMLLLVPVMGVAGGAIAHASAVAIANLYLIGRAEHLLGVRTTILNGARL